MTANFPIYLLVMAGVTYLIRMLPLTIFRIEEHHQAAIIEMGMNHFGELDRIAKAVRPNIGVISNVGVAHIEFLGSREGILKAKCEMLAHLEKGF